MSKGHLPVPRALFSSPLWQEPREFSRAEAWLDLYQSANYAPRQHIAQGRCLSLARGELVASVRYLGSRWQWSRGRVERYLKLLKSPPLRLIETRTETGITIVTILNYDTYARYKPPSETPARPHPGHPRDKEEERKESKNSLPPQAPPPGGPQRERALVSLPTLEQWHRYAQGRPGYQPAAFAALYHYNAARGWSIGGRPVASWQALVDSKLAELAPPAPASAAGGAKAHPPEPAAWRERMRQLYPRSTPEDHTWAYICQTYPDLARQLAS